MSVAFDWEPAAQGADTARRPNLTVVPPLPDDSTPRGRLTRRGRLVRTLMIFTLLMIAVLHVVDPAPEPPELTVDHVATVGDGQSLTDIVRGELPALPVEEGIRRIRLVNDLRGTGIYPGQVLQIPVNR